jgi:hypothetical protein
MANAAIEPSTIAVPVASRPTFSESRNDERTSGFDQATRNQWVVQPGSG